MTETIRLLSKYDKPIPRYTSYPTVPHWNLESFSLESWHERLKENFVKERGAVSVYIHLPFCENLCTFCACTKRITTNHRVESPYIDAVLREWSMYKELLPFPPVVREIHLGGGTPTFFSAENLRRLTKGILDGADLDDEYEFSVEVHPSFTREEHLQALSESGYRRISVGIQDFDPVVQDIINRRQTFEDTQRVVQSARFLGFTGVNVDLVYGLPRQTLSSISSTLEKTALLDPDRIAYYSYAFVPWKSKAQRRYSETDLPDSAMKWKMIHLGMETLTKMGYETVGMDHFAKPKDRLAKMAREGTLHRNFMGYSTHSNRILIGLGASSISDAWTGYAQNEEEVEIYQERIKRKEWPVKRGHLVSPSEIQLRQTILDIMCLRSTDINSIASGPHEQVMMDELNKMALDGILELENTKLRVTPRGRFFVRNISATIDPLLSNTQLIASRFSRSI